MASAANMGTHSAANMAYLLRTKEGLLLMAKVINCDATTQFAHRKIHRVRILNEQY